MEMLHSIPTPKAPHGEYYVMSEPGVAWERKKEEILRRDPDFFRNPLVKARKRPIKLQ